MFTTRQILQTKNKAVILLLVLFFMATGTCAIQKIIVDSLHISLENSKQPKASVSSAINFSSCPLDQCSIGKSSLSNHLQKNVRLLSTDLPRTSIIGLFAYKPIANYSFKEIPIGMSSSNTPLFLKHRSIII